MTIDTYINALIQQIQIPTLITLAKFIGTITDTIAIATYSLIITIYLYLKKSKRNALFFATTIAITGLTIKLSKEIIQRSRPLIANSYQLISSYAFPSGHATIAVVFFGLITYLFITKRQKLAAIATTLIILLISFTRIYLQVHWFTDIIAGIVLGIIILAISITIHKNHKLFM